MTGVVRAQHFFPVPAVVQTCQAIGARQTLQFGVCRLQLAAVDRDIGDVIDDQAHGRRCH